jgi:hypothetical protein
MQKWKSPDVKCVFTPWWIKQKNHKDLKHKIGKNKSSSKVLCFACAGDAFVVVLHLHVLETLAPSSPLRRRRLHYFVKMPWTSCCALDLAGPPWISPSRCWRARRSVPPWLPGSYTRGLQGWRSSYDMQHQQDNKGEAWRRHAQAVYGREKGGCGMPNC